MPLHAKKASSLVVLFLLVSGLVFADPPAGYYDSVDTTSQATLRVTLHSVIATGHSKIPYTASSTDTWNVLELADQDPNDSGRILDVYENNSFPKYGAGNNDYNREHSWPKSYGFPDDGSSNYAYSDCHQLFLCDSGYNSSRSNNIYDECSSGCLEKPTVVNDGMGGGTGVFPGNSNWRTGTGPTGIWQTWVGRKGDVARAQFYMDVRYEGQGADPDLILTDDINLIVADASNNKAVAYMGRLATLLQWHLDDPVDDRERHRNDTVYTYQGNRNPFIDNPQWAAKLFIGVIAQVVQDLPAGPAVGIASIYPNPFNPSTSIELAVNTPGAVLVEIYALDGTRVRTLLHGSADPGPLTLRWDGTNDGGLRAASGAYFCRVFSGGASETRPLLMLK